MTWRRRLSAGTRRPSVPGLTDERQRAPESGDRQRAPESGDRQGEASDTVDPQDAASSADDPNAGAPDPGRDSRPTPSFRYKLHESMRRVALLRADGMRPDVWRHNGKLAGYRLAEECGVPSPKLFRSSVELESLSAADLAEFGDRFVVKPHDGAFARGVHLLVRQDDDRYLDLTDGAEHSWSEIVKSSMALAEAGRISRGAAIEELLSPASNLAVPVPDDWKVYCFYDRPVLVMQRRTFTTAQSSTWRFRYWSAEWDDLGAAMDPARHGPDLEPPVDGAGLLEAASVLGRAMAAPFCRIDLYETDRGVVFGEVTPHPGGPQRWRPDVDEMLGEAWETAEARLLAEGVRWVVPMGAGSTD